MIPATHPHTAHYKHQATHPDGKPRTYHTSKPVIAWDDDGHPLVAGARRLQRADTWTNYDGITPGQAAVAAVLPGGGWMAEHDDEVGGTWSEPVLAWTFLADGTCLPVDVCADGMTDDPTEDASFVRLYHPDATEADEAPPVADA